MRLLEALLLSADLLTLIVFSVRQLGALPWLRHMAIVASMIAVTQWLTEGPRWQMVPAYALTALFFLVWMLQNFPLAGASAGQKRIHRFGAATAIGLGVLALAVSVALPLVIPVFRFADPTGPYAIGTLTYHWVDASRSEVFSADPNDGRALMVQIWYPANVHPGGSRAAYIPDAEAVTAALARIHHLPEFLLGHFKIITTNAFSSAPVADAQPQYPVLIFLEGVTGFRQMNTFQVEEMVSHGYIVVAIDQPGAAALVVFPDGHQVAGLGLAQLHAAVGPSYLPVGPDLSQHGSAGTTVAEPACTHVADGRVRLASTSVNTKCSASRSEATASRTKPCERMNSRITWLSRRICPTIRFVPQRVR